MSNWQDIWASKEKMDSNDIESLISESGFSDAGITVDTWCDYVNKIAEKLSINENTSVFDFGCGCGAFASALANHTKNISGIDLNKSFIDSINKVFPNFICGDFVETEITNKYDVILSNSVFQYIGTTENTQTIMDKMLSIGNDKCTIALLDICDMTKKENYDTARSKNLNISLDEYNKRYSGDLSHLFFDK